MRDAVNGSGLSPDGVLLSRICGDLLRRGQQVHNAIWLEEVGDEPTGPQYTVLNVIAAWPDINQRRLGNLASLDKSSTADIVARLVDRGLLSKRRAPEDARRDIVAPSETARRMLADLVPCVVRVQERFLESLAPQRRRAFVRQLSAIGRVEHLDSSVSGSHFRAPGHLIRRAQQVHTAIFAEEFGRELTGSQYATLHVLSVHPGLSQRELGEYAALSTSTAADIVDRLVRRGWISRYRDPSDRRRKALALTEAALEVMPSVSRVLTVQDRLLDPLPEVERAELLSALTAIVYPATERPTSAPRTATATMQRH